MKQELIEALQRANIEYIDKGYQLSIGNARAWINRSGRPTIKIKHRQRSFDTLSEMLDYVDL